MKQVLCFALAFVLIFSIGMTAFADGSVTKPASSDTTTASFPSIPTYNLEAFNASDVSLGKYSAERASVSMAGFLDKADREAFLAAYDEAKSVTDRVVKYFFWLNVKNFEAPEGFAYFKFPFSCTGENVQVSVNGKSMEVVHVDGNSYYAKLTELGAVAISCDK